MSENKKQSRRPPFSVGDTVYFTAFLKEDPDLFYICQGEITKTPGGERNSFRVRVKAIGNHAIGKDKSECQKVLIGRAMNKKGKELSKALSPFMVPKTWLK